MCAILDVNRAHEFVHPAPSEPVRQLKRWLENGRGRLIVGGKLLNELYVNKDVRQWIADLTWAGRTVLLSPDESRLVRERAKALTESGDCKSDDEHIIALAQVSGARLLYTNDKDLQADFTNTSLIKNPPGKLYPISANKTVRRKLLDRRNICNRKC